MAFKLEGKELLHLCRQSGGAW